MKRHRVLIVGMNYAPEVTGIAPYTSGLAEGLTARGHMVTVVTAFPHYPAWRWMPPYSGLSSREVLNGVPVRRFRHLLPRNSKSTIWRVVYDTSFAMAAAVSCIRLPRQDVVICVSPPIQATIVAWIFALAWQCPLILSVKDLPLEAGRAVGLIQSRWPYRIGQGLERFAYRRAAKICIIERQFGVYLARIGVNQDRIVQIADWADPSVQPTSDRRSEFREMLGARRDDWLIVHTGNMGEKQALGSAVLAAERAADLDHPLAVALVGDGSTRETLEGLIKARRLTNVQMLPLQPAATFPYILAAADALLLHQKAEIVDSVLPSKLLTYMAVGRPIIAAVNRASAAAEVVGSAECGVVVPPEDPTALVDACMRLKGDPELAARLGRNGARYARAHFAKESVIRAYAELISQVAEG